MALQERKHRLPLATRLGRAVGITGLVGFVVLGIAYVALVVLAPGAPIDKARLASLAVESPVYYRDGETRIGVFFDEDHRRFVRFEDLPRSWVAAVVAAEDARFFTHSGFDVGHLARAAVENLRAGHVVSGGSTLTQQTAKNLLDRSGRTLSGKLREAVVALQLESRLSKAEILTLYANHFHVTGNGRGLGIAARYFFDAEPSDLTLAQTAFLAGLVKAPAHFDPFVRDAAERDAVLARSEARTRYVLGRIVEVPAEQLAGPTPGPLATVGARQAFRERTDEVRGIQQEARRLLDDGFELDFHRGVFRWAPSAVLDEVARRLAEPPFDKVLSAAGIRDPDTAGLEIVTTIDQPTQRATEYGLWHDLTESGLLLEGLGDGLVLDDAAPPRIDPAATLEPRQFLTGTITARDKGTVTVDLGGKTCTVDHAGVQRIGDALRRHDRGVASAHAGAGGRGDVIDALPVGGLVRVSLRPGDVDLCDIEVKPELQGAAVVIEDGRIRAMVGGNDNRYFDRVTALRQMGSAWKPIVMHAALQLGWAPTDLLDNRPAEFRFSTTRYAPDTGHAAPDTVSMAWAAARSENVASVWLLVHLTDHLSHTETARLAERVDLAPRPGESNDDWRERLEQAGIRARSAEESLFVRARQRVLARIRQARHPDDAVALSSLVWDGRRLPHGLAVMTWSEVAARRAECRDAYARFVDGDGDERLSFRRDGSRLAVSCGLRPDTFGPYDATLAPRVRVESAPHLDPEGDLRLGALHASTIDALQRELDQDPLREQVEKRKIGPWDPELLYWNPDFRILLGMRYVTRIAQQYGVRTDVREVLSLPLGGSELTLEELAMVYDGMDAGETWRFPGRGPSGPLPEPAASTLLIEEIRDRSGHVLYRAEPSPVRVTSPAVAAMTRDLLRNVVTHGTGKRAADAVKVGGAALPLAGKTGTTDDNRNAAFVGLVPLVGRTGIEDALTVAVYVGYDDNRPLVHAGVRLQGANGALPPWIAIARGLADEGVLGPADVDAPRGGWTWPDPPGTERVAVSALDGTPTFVATGATVLTRPGTAERWLEPVERFDTPRPPRAALSTLDAENWTEAWDERAQDERSRLWSNWAKRERERMRRPPDMPELRDVPPGSEIEPYAVDEVPEVPLQVGEDAPARPLDDGQAPEAPEARRGDEAAGPDEQPGFDVRASEPRGAPDEERGSPRDGSTSPDRSALPDRSAPPGRPTPPVRTAPPVVVTPPVPETPAVPEAQPERPDRYAVPEPRRTQPVPESPG